MSKFLVILVVVLAVIAIGMLARVYELASALREKKEEEISASANNFNGLLFLVFMLAFYAFFFWQLIAYGDQLLPPAASEHGVALDQLLNFNWVILFIVFFLVNTLLFVFSYKYRRIPGRKAFYYPHNNKLELIWTIIPAVTMAVIIIYGLNTWNNIMDTETAEDAIEVELYARQFDWTARYAGVDGQLGAADYNFVSPTNALGIMSKESAVERLGELNTAIEKTEAKLENEVMGRSQEEKMKKKLSQLKKHRNRLLSIQKQMGENGAEYEFGYDDLIAKGEFHLPVNREVVFKFRSQDVIHSAYMPHFRAQMNTVPGMVTTFRMTPTITTDSMRTILDDEEFDYVLLCNKICGASHFNMQMNIIVESEEKYFEWLKEQKTFASSISVSPGQSEKTVNLAEVNP